MWGNRYAHALAVGAVLGFGGLLFGSPVSAADLPVKAPPPPSSPWVLDVHGFFDFNVANTRVTGGGLLLYNTDSLLIQPSVGLALDIYKDPKGFINSFSVFAGALNKNITDPHGLQAGLRHWQEMDWWAGFSVGFAQHWTFSAQHLEFVFPWDGTAFNDVFKLAFDDSYWGWPITFNPYFQVFYTERGGSTVIFGKRSGTERLEAGIVPTLSLMKPFGIPLTFTAPTWVEFGPSSFWNRNDGTTNFCGPTPAIAVPCPLNNVGYVSSGLQAKYTLESIIPKRLGVWYVRGGVQWVHIVNDALLAAQTSVGTAVVANFPQAKRDVAVVSGGFGFSF